MTLKPFGDRDVTEAAMKIVGTGDGLSEALEVDPAEHELGDTVYVVLKATVTKITYERIKDSEELRRVETVKAVFGALVDELAARKLLEYAKRAIEDAHGVQRLPGTDE